MICAAELVQHVFDEKCLVQSPSERLQCDAEQDGLDDDWAHHLEEKYEVDQQQSFVVRIDAWAVDAVLAVCDNILGEGGTKL